MLISGVVCSKNGRHYLLCGYLGMARLHFYIKDHKMAFLIGFHQCFIGVLFQQNLETHHYGDSWLMLF